MKRVFTIVVGILMGLLFVSCEQPTMLSVSQTALTFENSGGNQSVTITANKVWTASSNQGWLRVSPSSGEGTTTLSVSCEGNTTYDSRTGNITIVSEELTQTISVTQAEGLGLIVSQTEYNITNDAQTLSVEVQANVQYIVDIDAACRDWIKQNSTKALSPNTVKFDISKNESYDGREGKITIRQTNGSLSATVVVKQSQNNGMFVDQTAYDISYEEQQLNIKVKSNVNYEVQIDDSCKDWISRVGTKGLTESTVTLAIAMNEDEEREGKVILKYGSIQEAVKIKQAGGFVEFEDANFKAYCVSNFDSNKDGNISFSEALAINNINVNTDNIESLTGIERFTNLRYLSCRGSSVWDSSLDRNVSNGKLTSLDVSNNTALTHLDCCWNQLTSLVTNNTTLTSLECIHNQLTSLDVSNNTALERLSCQGNQLTNLDVSNNTAIEQLECYHNQLTSLDVSNNTALQELHCSFNQLTRLDMSKNIALKLLSCEGNQLINLDMSNNTSLVELYCYTNHLTSIDVSNNTALQKLSCHDNQLTNIDVSNCTKLVDLNCHHNQLTNLDVSNHAALVGLYCMNNQLSSLDVSNNTNLINLWCYSNTYLKEIWLKTGQTIQSFRYDTDIATIKYK